MFRIIIKRFSSSSSTLPPINTGSSTLTGKTTIGSHSASELHTTDKDQMAIEAEYMRIHQETAGLNDFFDESWKQTWQ
uniref:Uncharacterized protein n=1 Tax=Acrobeloides nanus TaxID=290746 RepID=A0A914DLK9_9BILA